MKRFPADKTEAGVHIAIRHSEEEPEKKVVTPGEPNAVPRVISRRFHSEDYVVTIAQGFEPPKIDCRKLIVRIDNKNPFLFRKGNRIDQRLLITLWFIAGKKTH